MGWLRWHIDMVPARKCNKKNRAAECAWWNRASWRPVLHSQDYRYRILLQKSLILTTWTERVAAVMCIFLLLAKMSWRRCQYVRRQRTVALTPSQIKHSSTCNEFHHNTDQFKTPPQTNRSRLQKGTQTLAVKQHKDETAASTFGYFGVTAWVNFLWNKKKGGGGGGSV